MHSLGHIHHFCPRWRPPLSALHQVLSLFGVKTWELFVTVRLPPGCRSKWKRKRKKEKGRGRGKFHAWLIRGSLRSCFWMNFLLMRCAMNDENDKKLFDIREENGNRTCRFCACNRPCLYCKIVIFKMFFFSSITRDATSTSTSLIRNF